MIDPVFIVGFQLVSALVLAAATFLVTFWWLPRRAVKRICWVAPIVGIVSFYTLANLVKALSGVSWFDWPVAVRVAIPLSAALVFTIVASWVAVRQLPRQP